MIYRRRGRLRPLSALTGHRAVTFVDQALSSISNLILAVAVAQTATASEFGVYALITGVYWLALGGLRAIISEPFLIHRPDLELAHPYVDRAVSCQALLLGGSCGLVVSLAGAFFGQLAFVVLGLFLPLLLWQDAGRYVAFARREPQAAAISDATWLVLQLTATVFILKTLPNAAVWVWIVAWGVAAGAGALAGAAANRAWPGAVRDAVRMYREIRATSRDLMGDFLLIGGAQQAVLFALPAITSLSLLGALKAAQVAVRPLTVILVATSVMAIPAISQLSLAGDFSAARRRGFEVAAVISICGLAYTLLMLALPESWGSLLFGASWKGGKSLVVYVAIQSAIVGLIQGAAVLLRGTRNTRRNLFVRAVLTPWNILLPLGGAALDGTQGLGIALVISASGAALVWWWAALTAVAKMRSQII